MDTTEILSKKITLQGVPFAQLRASGVADADNFRFTSKGVPMSVEGSGSTPPVTPYQNTPVIVCVITG